MQLSVIPPLLSVILFTLGSIFVCKGYDYIGEGRRYGDFLFGVGFVTVMAGTATFLIWLS